MLKRAILLGLIAILMISTIVYASWEYKFHITLTDTSGTGRAYYPVNLGFGAQTLVDGGKIDANGLDTNMQIGASTIAYMLADDRVLAVLPSLPANESKVVDLYTGYAPVQTSFQIIEGYNGYITTLDAAALELGDDFTIIVDGYVNTAVGASKNIVIKPNGAGYAFKLYVSAASEITASIDDDACVAVATGIVSGEYEIKVIADGTNLEIYIDDVLEDTTALVAATVPDTADNYIWNQTNVMPYINYIKLQVR